MDEISRIIGKIESFQESAEVRFNKLEEKLDDLYVFRWKIVGAVSVVAILGEIVVHMIGGMP